MTTNIQAPRPASQSNATAQPSAAELKEQIKQSILAAQDAAREAEQEGARSNARGGRAIIIGPGGPPLPPGLSGTAFPNSHSDFPPQVADISIAFFIMCAVMVIGWPLARAFGKRLERRGDVAAVNSGASEQLARIEQAVEAMAIEVERISESQRFIAKLQNAQVPNRELKSS